jgi:mannose-1-phosphate guanylyltransferase/mannose-6-phosphate isomerase
MVPPQSAPRPRGRQRAIVAVLAAHHVFDDGNQSLDFVRSPTRWPRLANEIVTFGVTPDRPAIGYSYIYPRAPLALDPAVRRIERFADKPDETRARSLKTIISRTRAISSSAPTSCWRNSSVSSRRARRRPRPRCRLLERNSPLSVLDQDSFANAPKTSVDYAVFGANQQGGGPDGGRGLIGCRRVVNGLAAEPPPRQLQ